MELIYQLEKIQGAWQPQNKSGQWPKEQTDFFS